MKFLMLIKHAEDFKREDVPPQMFEAMGEFVTANLKSGVILDTAGLQPTQAGFRVRLDGGRLTVTDGPFVETKEVLGGFYLVDVPNLDDALEFASKVPAARLGGAVEVRPLVER
jgi:hypothetical protein